MWLTTVNICVFGNGITMHGYFVLHTRWHTLDRLAEYQAGAQSAISKYGGRGIVYDTRPELVEGESTLSATVIIEFDDLASAKTWYHSPEYQQVLPIRLESSEGVGRIVGTNT